LALLPFWLGMLRVPVSKWRRVLVTPSYILKRDTIFRKWRNIHWYRRIWLVDFNTHHTKLIYYTEDKRLGKTHHTNLYTTQKIKDWATHTTLHFINNLPIETQNDCPIIYDVTKEIDRSDTSLPMNITSFSKNSITLLDIRWCN
jgi:hypothetical protein